MKHKTFRILAELWALTTMLFWLAVFVVTVFVVHHFLVKAW